MSIIEPSPELGELINLWTDAYNGQKAYFVNNTILVYTCGSSLKFFDTETKHLTSFIPEHVKKSDDGSNGICLLTANSAINRLAFSETQLTPNIYIFSYDKKLKEEIVISNGALNEYLSIEFSNSEAILALAGCPEYKIFIWNWKNGDKIAELNLNQTQTLPERILFSPINWRHILIAYKNHMHLWNLEYFDQAKFKLTSKFIRLPPTDRNTEELVVGKDFQDEFSYSNRAITLLDERYDDLIESSIDKLERHEFRTFCWSNDNEILVATKENYVFKYSLNENSMRLVFKPGDVPDDNKEFSLDETNYIVKLYLHRHGLFVCCNDGKIAILDGSDLIPFSSFENISGENESKLGIRKIIKPIEVKRVINMQASFISKLNFNTTFSKLSISSDKGIYILNCADLFEDQQHSEHLELVIDYDQSKTIGLASVHPAGDNFIALKENGTIQLWNIKTRKIIDRLHLNEQCTQLTTHPSMPLVTVGTASGAIYFIDFSTQQNVKILEKCYLHKKSIKFLKFNSSGTILISIGNDNKLFFIDCRLSPKVESALVSLDQRLMTNYNKQQAKYEPGFYVLGYSEFEGDPICMDCIDYLSNENLIYTRIVLGIHDSATWESSIRKNIQEININDTKAQHQAQSMNIQHHNILVQTAQTESVLSRFISSTDQSLSKPDYNFLNNQEKVKLACKLITYEFNFSIFSSDKNRIYATKKLDFKDEVLNKQTFYTQYLFSDCVLTARNYLLTYSDTFLTKFTLPEIDLGAKKQANKLNFLEFNEIVGTQDFSYGCLSRSNNNHFILTGGFDGSLTLRTTNDLRVYIQTRPVHFTNGGVKNVRFHNDGLSILVLGNDDTINNVNWNCINESLSRTAKNFGLEGDVNRNELAKLDSASRESLENIEAEKLTWYDLKEREYFKEQDKQYLPIKNEIIKSLEDIRKKLQELMKVNENRDELSKLKENEFYLDLEELERLNKEADSEILNIREKNELENLAKLYVRNIIKKECWDDMKVKGRGLMAFNNNLLVENYPLKERTKEELNYLEKVKLIRRIEIAAQKTRNELTNEIMKKDNISEIAELDDEENENLNQTNSTTTQKQDSNNVPNYLNPNLAQLAFKGSLAPLFGGDSSYFYHQFELFTREQKWMQIALINESIYKIKENFNKEFEAVMQRKNQEIGKIKEKNQRLKQIYIDLNEDKQLIEPQYGDSENPELLLDVKDNEIKVEKYLTPEQRKQLEEQLAEEARRRELERLDNWRERGLMDMMGGVLQIRREDELKKDIPVPTFVQEKNKEEWTLDEQKQYVVYEQKVKELNEEREKLRKQLNSEILKINEQIAECYQNFDNYLLNLHLRKVKTQQAIYQEELKILRLVNSILVDGELEKHETQINIKLENLKEQKKQIAQEIQHLKKIIDNHKEEYDILIAEDKAQEKAFMREFSDVSISLRDQLFKLFKKRVKQRLALTKTFQQISNQHTNQQFPLPELGDLNPFSDRPSTAQQLNLYEQDTEEMLNEMDKIENAPNGIDQFVWDRFIQFRRQKIDFENKLKMKSLSIIEMSNYLQKRLEEDEQMKRKIDDFSKDSLSLQDLRLKAHHNLQIQLLMKQGQVEIDPNANVHNFKKFLLINRAVVESLNKIIQDQGNQKINTMKDSKDYRKGNRQLEWEHKKMKMTIEDYIQKQRDITYLKLTREIQDYLNTVDYDGKIQKEIATLEQTLAYQSKQHEKEINQKNKKLKDIRKQSTKTANLNDQYDDRLKEQNVSLFERKHINLDMTGKSMNVIREEKFQQIIQRRKLVDLAKAQAQEVAFLRSEVERLRMKTFPALVQIEY